MNYEKMKEEITQYCYSLGLETIGFIPCRPFEELREFYLQRQQKNLQNEFEEKEIELRIHPNHYMEDGKTILSIAFPYVTEEQSSDNGFSIYTKRFDYHKVVKKYVSLICDYIQQLGGKAESFVDSNTLPERYIAYLAGVGFIGRNNMIITKQYGSYVFLGEIITDLPLPCNDKRTIHEIKQYKECGDCIQCYKSCPTKSIHVNRVNPNICLSYLTQKKEITYKETKLLKGNIFGCDDCQKECPYNEKAKKSLLVEFQPFEYMEEEAERIASMDNQYFKEKILVTSCGWRGKNVLRRNALIRLHREGKKISIYRGESPYINKYIDLLEEE